jgi:hypothetical protein
MLSPKQSIRLFFWILGVIPKVYTSQEFLKIITSCENRLWYTNPYPNSQNVKDTEHSYMSIILKSVTAYFFWGPTVYDWIRTLMKLKTLHLRKGMLKYILLRGTASEMQRTITYENLFETYLTDYRKIYWKVVTLLKKSQLSFILHLCATLRTLLTRYNCWTKSYCSWQWNICSGWP